jgi:hypothetical protein
MTVVALLAAALATPAGSAHFMSPNAAVFAPTVVAGFASLNWAGYTLSGAPSYTSVHATWTVPAASCDTGQASMSAFWVGLGGFSRTATGVEQIGTASNCDGKGRPAYFAWYELFPAPAQPVPVSVQPGDTIDASVTANRDGTYTLTLNGFSTTQVGPAADNTSAEWITEAPSTCTPMLAHCKPLPLTDFGSVTFGNMDATPFDGPMFKITMVTQSFAIKAVPTPFDGSGFTVYRLHK